MIKANFNVYNSYVTDSLYQWDKDQILQVSGINIEVAPEIHFTNCDMDKSIIRHGKLDKGVISVKIPNSMLQSDLDIKVYIGKWDGSVFTTLEMVVIPVIARNKPYGYSLTVDDEEFYSFSKLENAIANMITINDFNIQIDKLSSDTIEKIEVLKTQIANIIAHNNDTNSNSELLDLRVGSDGITYSSAGESVRGQYNSLRDYMRNFENLATYTVALEFIGDEQICSKRENVNIEPGDILYINNNTGARINILAYDASGTQTILINDFKGNAKTTIIADKVIKQIGAFRFDMSTTHINISISKCITSEKLADKCITLEKLDDDLLKEIVGVKDDKIDGNFMYNTNGVVIMEGKLARGDADVRLESFDMGVLAKADVINIKKAKITGFGWDSNLKYFVYAIVDINGKILDRCIADHSEKRDLEIVIPENAHTLYVNGQKIYHIPKIELYSRSCDFNQNFNNAYNKKINNGKIPKLMTLGDSITMLGLSNTGWIKYFNEKTGCKLIANVAMNGAVLADKLNTKYDGNPQQNNEINNVLGNQVQKIINNNYEAPDIIMIAIGTNGGINISKTDIKTAYYDSSNNLIPLINVDRKTHAGAYRYATEKLHELYPNAIILWCAPILAHQKIRNAESILSYAESLRIATEYSGQNMIDTTRCGINGINEVNGGNGQYLVDGLHPNVEGAKKIGYYNASKVFPFLR